jgi:DNA-nicking Smr family endonuclease
VTRRRLKPEEVELWQKVAETADALHRRQTFDPETYASKPIRKKNDPMQQPITLDGRTPPKPVARKSSVDLVPSLNERFRQAPVQMDRKVFSKLKKGKLKPEARIDLHGMTLDRAHGALMRFILSSHGAGRRLVLVITGKGKDRDDGGPIPTRFGILRHQVPQWLGTPPLSSMVMQITPAHVSHGGGGAYYVYLRRQR